VIRDARARSGIVQAIGLKRHVPLRDSGWNSPRPLR
jgi:hypothetical protein